MYFSRETIPIASGSSCMEEIMRHVCESDYKLAKD